VATPTGSFPDLAVRSQELYTAKCVLLNALARMRTTNNETSGNQAKCRERPSVQNWGLFVLGWLPPLVGVFGWIAGLLHGEEPPFASALFVFGLLASVTISIVLHELAHFYAAKFLGLAPWCISLGSGTVVFDKQLSGWRLVLRAIPYAGAIYPFLLPHQEHETRGKRFLMTLAGPSANAVLLAIFALFASSLPEAGHSPTMLPQCAIPTEMLLANAYLLLVSLIPFRPTINGLRTPNDGLQLILLVLGRTDRVWQSGNSDTSTATAGTTNRPSAPGWDWMVGQVRPEALLEAYRRQLDNPGLSISDRCLLLDAFATCVLMYGAITFLPEAEQYSEELMGYRPNEWTIKGTRGSVLVEKGHLDAGIAMLTEVVAQDPSLFDRAIAASFLALAEWKRNNRQAAAEWLQRSLEFDPKCVSARRISSILNSGVTAG
jgi:hypothetical protein